MGRRVRRSVSGEIVMELHVSVDQMPDNDCRRHTLKPLEQSRCGTDIPANDATNEMMALPRCRL
jgi:hypothetical protein